MDETTKTPPGQGGPPTPDTPAPEAPDVVLVHGRTDDGQGLRGLRLRPGRLDAAEIRPVPEGRPLMGSAELIRLHPRREVPAVCDVEVVYRPGEAESDPPGHAGPARVATAAYRRNWELVFAANPPATPPPDDDETLLN